MTSRLWAALGLCFGVSLTPFGALVLYPFSVFTTWVHECSHALAAVALGGHVASITIQPDTSGLTRSLMPASRIAQGIVASAGYLGASVVGCFLLTASRVDRRARPILLSIAGFMLLTVALWIRNLFGVVVVLGWAAALFALAGRHVGRAAAFVLTVLAIQVALNAVFDIRMLFFVRGASDAATMARLFFVPAWFWAAAWMAISIALLISTLRATGRSRK